MGLWRKTTPGFIWKMAHSSVAFRRPTRERRLPGSCSGPLSVCCACLHITPRLGGPSPPRNRMPGRSPCIQSGGCPSGQRAFGTARCSSSQRSFTHCPGPPNSHCPCLAPFMATLLTLESRAAMSQSFGISFSNHDQPETLQTSGTPVNILLLCPHFGK